MPPNTPLLKAHTHSHCPTRKEKQSKNKPLPNFDDLTHPPTPLYAHQGVSGTLRSVVGMNFFNRLRETLTHLDNALDNAAHPQAGRPVFAVIDTETTGFNKRYDRIIEIAVARFDESFRLVDQWHTLINPDGKQIKNSHIHGITNADVAHAPTFPEVYTEFATRVDGLVLMAHNAPFDSKMILAEAERIIPDGEDVYFPFVDTIALAKQMVSLRSYKLASLLDHVGLNNPQSHAAIADATATGQMLNKLFGREAAKIARQIIDQAVTFNAAHTTGWGLPCKPTATRR